MTVAAGIEAAVGDGRNAAAGALQPPTERPARR
jgi:hypothetical protein